MGEHPAARAASAAQRTGLLHRMLLVRRLEQLRPQAVPAGDEAVAVGLLSVLGPQDAVVSAGDHPWHAVGAAALLFGGDVTAVPDAAEATAAARRKGGDPQRRVVVVCSPAGPEAGGLALPAFAGVPVLFCRGEHLDAPGRSPVLTILSADSCDVEAIAAAATAEAGAVRTGAGPCLLSLRAGGDDADPVELLAARMRTDHQLDRNALRAIERDASARAEAVLQRLGHG